MSLPGMGLPGSISDPPLRRCFSSHRSVEKAADSGGTGQVNLERQVTNIDSIPIVDPSLTDDRFAIYLSTVARSQIAHHDLIVALEEVTMPPGYQRIGDLIVAFRGTAEHSGEMVDLE
jgi:hypothetical protein